MTWPWSADTVTRIRPVVTVDPHGDDRLDWVHADRLDCAGAMFAPAEDGTSGTVYFRSFPDIARGDHLEHTGRRFEVVVNPQRWPPGLVVPVEAVDIPGQ